MCVLRPDGSFELTNPALADAIELEREPGRTLLERVHPDDRVGTLDAFDRARRDGRSVSVVNRFCGRNGEYGTLEWRVRPHPESGLLYLLGSDVSAARRTQDALLESQRKLQALVQFAAQGILTVDTEGAIRSANPMLQQIFGYEENELIGKSVEMLLPESLRRVHAVHRQTYNERPRPRAMGHGLDLLGRRKDGTPVPVEISLSHIRSEQGTLIVALVSDISERRRAQEETRQLQRRLEHATKMEAVGRLAGGIAHDFNNLLTALSAFGEIVLDELPPTHPLCEGAREVQRTCQRSVSLVRRLLAVSRRQILQPTVLDVGEKVTELSKMLRTLLGDDVELIVSTHPAGRAKLDESQLEQVVLNLVVNAKDAMPHGGRLSVGTESRELNGRRFVALQVTDTGRGMDAETLARIFEPFFTTREQGTGLGLATVKSIVEQSGGRIDVESEPDRGTTFEVLLPEAREEAETPPRPESRDPRPGPRGSETILVAESENSVRLVVVDSLRRAGYHVIEARDGDEAIRLSSEYEGALNLVLTDVIMPRTSGPEIVSRLREKRPQLRALFMSGHSRDALSHHVIGDDPDAFLEKPFTRDALTTRVRRALDDGTDA